jgi:hypothetical protein
MITFMLDLTAILLLLWRVIEHNDRAPAEIAAIGVLLVAMAFALAPHLPKRLK